ncbi:MAG: DNA polymerase III subunit epsilon [Rhizobiaceae bacterium]
MREIIFDTETTGISHREGHRIIEIGAIEIINSFPSGRTFHEYIKPDDKEIEKGAFDVHGISAESLKDKPLFKDILPQFKEFFAEGKLIAHNASFDIGFFNAELARVGEPPIDNSRVIDTLAIARRKFPGAKNSLDALCSRFGISNAHRTLHGALLDSELLAEVYVELNGGKQGGFSLDSVEPVRSSSLDGQNARENTPQRQRENPLASRLSTAEKEAHETMIEDIGDNAIWHKWSHLQ